MEPCALTAAVLLAIGLVSSQGNSWDGSTWSEAHSNTNHPTDTYGSGYYINTPNTLTMIYNEWDTTDTMIGIGSPVDSRIIGGIAWHNDGTFDEYYQENPSVLDITWPHYAVDGDVYTSVGSSLYEASGDYTTGGLSTY